MTTIVKKGAPIIGINPTEHHAHANTPPNRSPTGHKNSTTPDTTQSDPHRTRILTAHYKRYLTSSRRSNPTASASYDTELPNGTWQNRPSHSTIRIQQRGFALHIPILSDWNWRRNSSGTTTHASNDADK